MKKIYRADYYERWVRIIANDEGDESRGEVLAIFTDAHPERDVAVMQELGRLRKAQDDE